MNGIGQANQPHCLKGFKQHESEADVELARQAEARIKKAACMAESRKVSVLCLGALNKAEWMNNGRSAGSDLQAMGSGGFQTFTHARGKDLSLAESHEFPKSRVLGA